MRNSLAAEWLKIRSVRSTYWILAVVIGSVLLGACLAWLGARGWDELSPDRRTRFQAPAMEQAILPLAQLCVAVLGVLAITSEYTTGTITSSLTVRPQRMRLAAAKIVVVGSVALVAGLVFLFGTFGAARWIVGDRPLSPGYTTSVSEEIPMLLVTGLVMTATALIGLGFGVMLRSAAGAISAVVTLLLFLPMVSRFVPQPWDVRLSSVMLPNLAEHITHGSWAAATALVLYVAGALGGAAILLKRRDIA
ncbi:ABC-type transport system involved in multi-copper enzyme maturation permease subunit [Kibdelosporangium banguiense]|uniref:ABC-type transport system involved in multi-copper enzyme maturation permease subunit n=1 Tax=Kibdelosporangium banguiense TaxID=1365924 RepID=A0ABS4THW5_9PSEU|nr:ABC transporter permease [Kibdelosporangium banguiense]MBP2324032.1 ABC-type transport system involved in multi-copper enzyme maturation permease subunit [Kibdelosporangium banguiense]